MPFGQRLARVVPPTKQWHSLGASVTRPAAVAAGMATPCPPWRIAGSRRTAANATTARQWRDGDDDQQQTKPSIFEELFPEEARSRSRMPKDETGPDTARFRDSDSVPDEVRQWLQSESEAEAQDGERSDAAGGSGRRPAAQGVFEAAKARKRKTEPTVLVLSGTTASLLPSDFFRIAPRVFASQSAGEPETEHGPRRDSGSRPVDGWAAGNGGIYKIVQDRDPTTLAPRGRYFLYFGSSAAALAYAQEVRDLHTLARRAVQPPQRGKGSARRRQKRQQEEQGGGGFAGNSRSSGSSLGSDAYLVSTATEEEAAALRSFSLLAPTARLDLAMQMPAGGSGSGGSNNSGSSLTLYDDEELDDVAATDATTKVLVVLEDTSSTGGGGAGSSIYGDSDSTGVTTVEGLRSLIEDDGVRRNLPWAVSDGLNGVVPVRWLVAEQKRLLQEAVAAAAARSEQNKGKKKERQNTSLLSSPPTALWASRVPDLVAKTDQMNEHARFARFVVAFADAVEARRFVRSWHRRAVTVPGTGPAAGYVQTAAVDATVLW